MYRRSAAVRRANTCLPRSQNILNSKTSVNFSGLQRHNTTLLPSFEARLYTTQSEPGKIRVKDTTGLTGLPVQPRWRHILLTLFDQLLENAQTKLPEGVFYRQVIESNVTYWRKVVEEHTDYEQVESILGRGQVEEMIVMMQDELDLLEVMAQEQPWIITEENIKEEQALQDHFDMATPREYVRPPITLKPGMVKHDWLERSKHFPITIEEQSEEENVQVVGEK